MKRDDKSHFDLADQLQDLHATILERLDHLEQMRKKMRQEFVPTNVCQNLEQCLKDSEVLKFVGVYMHVHIHDRKKV